MALAVDTDHSEYAIVLAGFAPPDPDHLVETGTITFDSSYLTGGELLPASFFGWTSIDFLYAAPAGGLFPEFDHANQKLKLTTGNWSNASDGPLIEVGSTSNQSAVVVRFIALGKIAR